jgi:pyruvate formate lyase activating enzyme
MKSRKPKKKNIKGVIFDLQKYAIRDGPGIRTAVFFKGCPLRCAWCQNPEGLNPQPEKFPPKPGRTANGLIKAPETVGRSVTLPEVMEEIEKDRIFYEQSGGGVTFSGGEPLIQPDFLGALLRLCRRRGIHTAVETSGYAPWPVLKGIGRDADLFLYDLKVMDPAVHKRQTGVDNGLILENLARLAKTGARILIRLPVIPGINDSPAHAARLGRFVAGLRKVRRVDLLPFNALCREKYRRFNRPYRFANVKPPTPAALERIERRLAAHGLEVEIGG